MTVAHFSLSPALEKEFAKNRVHAVFLDILEDLKHIFGLEAKDCTLPAETAHTFWNHIADIAVDIPYLFPNRRIFQFTRFLFLALAFWFVIGQPLIKGIANINAGQPLVPNFGPINLPVFLAPPTATLTSTPSPTVTPSPTPTITPSPTATLTPTPTAPLPYAHNLEMELRPVCGLLSWSEVRPVFPEEMKVFGVRHVKDDWVSLDDISCVIFFAVPTDEDGNATGGVGFVFYTLKDEPGIKSITADFTSAYVKENQGFGIIWSVQEADQLFK